MASLQVSRHYPTPGTAYREPASNGKDLDWDDTELQAMPGSSTNAGKFWAIAGSASFESMPTEQEASDTASPQATTGADLLPFRRSHNLNRPRVRHVPGDTAQRILRSHFANQLLPSLKALADHSDEVTAARYATDLLTTMRTARDIAPFDPFLDVVLALHDALAADNRWIEYSSEQLIGAYDVLRKCSQYSKISNDKAEKAILDLEELGFDTTPFSLGDPTDD